MLNSAPHFNVIFFYRFSTQYGMTKNNGRFLSTSIVLLTFAYLYTAPVSAQTLHPEHLFEKNRVIASYALLEEEVEIDDSDDLDAVKDEVADWVYRVGDEWGKKVLGRSDLRNKKLKFVEVLRRTSETKNLSLLRCLGGRPKRRLKSPKAQVSIWGSLMGFT